MAESPGGIPATARFSSCPSMALQPYLEKFVSDTRNGSAAVFATAPPLLPAPGPGSAGDWREPGVALSVSTSRAQPGLLTSETSSQWGRKQGSEKWASDSSTSLGAPEKPALLVPRGFLPNGRCGWADQPPSLPPRQEIHTERGQSHLR